jgi:tetratricopeptide (TPR) repeat protein
MRDPSRIKLEEYGWEMTEEIQRGGRYYILNRHHRRALDSSCEMPGRRCSMTKPYGIAVRLVDQSRYDLAERQLRQSLQENPEHAAFHQRLGRKREAEAAIAQALMLDPDNDFTHTAQGWRLVEKGDRKAARAHFLEALRINRRRQRPAGETYWHLKQTSIVLPIKLEDGQRQQHDRQRQGRKDREER